MALTLGASAICKAVVISFVVVAGDSPATAALRELKPGDPIPAFAVKALDGRTLSNSTYKGKVLLMVLARPRQKKSLRALEAAQQIAGDFTDAKLAVLAVSTKPDSAESFERLAAEHGITYPMAMDPGRKLYGALGVIVSPTTLLVDESGVLRFAVGHIPPNFEKKLRIHTELLLGRIDADGHTAQLGALKQNKPDRFSAADRQVALVKTLMDQKRFELAAQTLAKLDRSENAVPVAVLAGTCYLALGDLDKASQELDPLASHKPASSELTLALGRLAAARGQDDKAVAYLRDALKLAPKKGPIFYELGRLHERQGRLQAAVDCYRKALDEAYGAQP